RVLRMAQGRPRPACVHGLEPPPGFRRHPADLALRRRRRDRRALRPSWRNQRHRIPRDILRAPQHSTPVISMKTLTKTMRAGLMLAAMLPFASGALLAQAESAPAPTPTAAPAKETPLHEIGGSAPAAQAVLAQPAAQTAPAAQAPAAPTAAPAAPEPKEERHYSHNENDRV